VVANLRTGHSGVDGRFASVYFDPNPGNELSAVFGCSYNCANQFTYQNASSSTWHGAPRILGEAVQAISAGCCYQRSGARGFGDRLGRFGSRAIGAWPQLDYSPEFRKTTSFRVCCAGWSEQKAKTSAA
jgi:hypothetical protein